MKLHPAEQATTYVVYNTATADVHIGTYAALAKHLQRVTGKPVPRHPRQTEHAHLYRCTRAAYPNALRITIKLTTQEEK